VSNVISIGIPTYHRPALLKEAIESCFMQGHRPLEIVIGDDSRNDETQALVGGLQAPDGVNIAYLRNAPALGQSGNVNSLFARAAGPRFMLLHDDDLLCADGLGALLRAWSAFPGARCVYGMQYVIDPAGAILDGETEALNQRFHRTASRLGRQASGFVAGLQQQMPNNAYLIETELARAVGYRRESDVGRLSVDADFAIRVGMAVADGAFVLIDDFVSKYRLSTTSIMRSTEHNHGQHLFFAYVEGLRTRSAAEEEAKQGMLRRMGLGASLDAAMAGQRAQGLRILLSRHYPKPMLSRWTMLRLLCLASPRIGVAAWRRLNAR
jgi:glycosyltransferase involved in cell wall biosynthesis